MKVKKTAKTTIKKKAKVKGAKKSEEPIVKVLNLNVNPDNPRNGFFELDWNDEFVNMLQQSGYEGRSEEEIQDELGKYARLNERLNDSEATFKNIQTDINRG